MSIANTTLNENPQQWLDENADDFGYVEMGDSGTADQWLDENATDFGYIHEHYVDEDERWVHIDTYNEHVAEHEEEIEKLKAEVAELKETCVPKDILFAERGGHEERLRDSQKEVDEWYCRCEMAESKASSYDEMKKECVGLRKLKAEVKRVKDKHNALLERLAPPAFGD
jgi:hypothetical protein